MWNNNRQQGRGGHAAASSHHRGGNHHHHHPHSSTQRGTFASHGSSYNERKMNHSSFRPPAMPVRNGNCLTTAPTFSGRQGVAAAAPGNKPLNTTTTAQQPKHQPAGVFRKRRRATAIVNPNPLAAAAARAGAPPPPQASNTNKQRLAPTATHNQPSARVQQEEQLQEQSQYNPQDRSSRSNHRVMINGLPFRAQDGGPGIYHHHQRRTSQSSSVSSLSTTASSSIQSPPRWQQRHSRQSHDSRKDWRHTNNNNHQKSYGAQREADLDRNETGRRLQHSQQQPTANREQFSKLPQEHGTLASPNQKPSSECPGSIPRKRNPEVKSTVVSKVDEDGPAETSAANLARSSLLADKDRADRQHPPPLTNDSARLGRLVSDDQSPRGTMAAARDDSPLRHNRPGMNGSISPGGGNLLASAGRFDKASISDVCLKPMTVTKPPHDKPKSVKKAGAGAAAAPTSMTTCKSVGKNKHRRRFTLDDSSTSSCSGISDDDDNSCSSEASAFSAARENDMILPPKRRLVNAKRKRRAPSPLRDPVVAAAFEIIDLVDDNSDDDAAAAPPDGKRQRKADLILEEVEQLPSKWSDKNLDSLLQTEHQSNANSEAPGDSDHSDGPIDSSHVAEGDLSGVSDDSGAEAASQFRIIEEEACQVGGLAALAEKELNGREENDSAIKPPCMVIPRVGQRGVNDGVHMGLADGSSDERKECTNLRNDYDLIPKTLLSAPDVAPAHDFEMIPSEGCHTPSSTVSRSPTVQITPRKNDVLIGSDGAFINENDAHPLVALVAAKKKKYKEATSPDDQEFIVADAIIDLDECKTRFLEELDCGWELLEPSRIEAVLHRMLRASDGDASIELADPSDSDILIDIDGNVTDPSSYFTAIVSARQFAYACASSKERKRSIVLDVIDELSECGSRLLIRRGDIWTPADNRLVEAIVDRAFRRQTTDETSQNGSLGIRQLSQEMTPNCDKRMLPTNERFEEDQQKRVRAYNAQAGRIVTAADGDIVMGRGKRICNRPGNARLAGLVSEAWRLQLGGFDGMTRHAATLRIVFELLNEGRRFLAKVADCKLMVMDFSMVLANVKQRIRDYEKKQKSLAESGSLDELERDADSVFSDDDSQMLGLTCSTDGEVDIRPAASTDEFDPRNLHIDIHRPGSGIQHELMMKSSGKFSPGLKASSSLRYGGPCYKPVMDTEEIFRNVEEDPIFATDGILNHLEMQLLWLGEESMYSLGKHEFQFEYIHFYSTEELRVELRKLRADASESEKINQLVDVADWQVRQRFEQGREEVRRMLNQGYRREATAHAIAEIRMAIRKGREPRKFPPIVVRTARHP